MYGLVYGVVHRHTGVGAGRTQHVSEDENEDDLADNEDRAGRGGRGAAAGAAAAAAGQAAVHPETRLSKS